MSIVEGGRKLANLERAFRGIRRKFSTGTPARFARNEASTFRLSGARSRSMSSSSATDLRAADQDFVRTPIGQHHKTTLNPHSPDNVLNFGVTCAIQI